ncbi:imidazole glycerol phosphate synthase subunit HisH [Macrococcus animalis]|uniref:imidazole glycerol phosphate synthase subunit HisH n=1 Tax=Macrococcus animalis TaxID=3395467 RepID=UPI0039BE8E17
MIAVVDYGIGNIQNVINALKTLGYEAKLTRNATDFEAATHIILPGVGHYKDAMHKLNQYDLVPLLTQYKDSKPFIGICLGMQLLYEYSEEGNTAGLSFIPGTVTHIQSDLPVPHLGWNNLISEYQVLNKDVYFIHSYIAPMADNIIAVADYGQMIPAIVQQNNLIGIQFHPEKSGTYGLEILQSALNGGFNND